MRKILLALLSLLLVSTLPSCGDDEPDTPPIPLGATVDIRNTLQIAADQSAGGTGGAEVPVEVVFGAPAGTYEISSSTSASIEFDDYLEGLYDIDLTENEISFNLVAGGDHPIYQAFFRTIEPGTFDRYYMTFPSGHNIISATTNNDAVTLNIINLNEIVVIIGEGWDFNPGSSFTINLN